MATANINIRTDADVKEKCESLYESLGMNMSTAINIFLRQSLRVNGLPFDVVAETPNETTLKAFREGDVLLSDSSAEGYGSIEELKKSLET